MGAIAKPRIFVHYLEPTVWERGWIDRTCLCVIRSCIGPRSITLRCIAFWFAVAIAFLAVVVARVALTGRFQHLSQHHIIVLSGRPGKNKLTVTFHQT